MWYSLFEFLYFHRLMFKEEIFSRTSILSNVEKSSLKVILLPFVHVPPYDRYAPLPAEQPKKGMQPPTCNAAPASTLLRPKAYAAVPLPKAIVLFVETNAPLPMAVEL